MLKEFFFSSRRRHTRYWRDWSSDVCSSDLSDLSDAELATFPTSYITSLRMLNRVRIAEGETILVTGASGGVGTGLVQLAKLRGAYVIAQVGSGKEEQARRIGTDAVVRRDAMDLAAEVRKAADGRSVDVVADVVGGPAFAKLLNVLRPMGRYVAAGAIAGPVVSLDLRTLYLKQLELIGSTMGTHEEFARDRKSTRLNSSHANISYAVFCLKKKNNISHSMF